LSTPPLLPSEDAILILFSLLDERFSGLIRYDSDLITNLVYFPTRRSSDLTPKRKVLRMSVQDCWSPPAILNTHDRKSGSAGMPRSEERFSRNAETDLVCRLLLEEKKMSWSPTHVLLRAEERQTQVFVTREP